MKPIGSAAIIAVGSELLTPSKLDTNSLFITEQLNLLGIDVKAKAVVGDDRTELEHVLRLWLARADLVVMCGGLGPTDDDLTREVVATVLERPLAEDEAITAHLRARFAARICDADARDQSSAGDGARGARCLQTRAAVRRVCGSITGIGSSCCCRDLRAS